MVWFSYIGRGKQIMTKQWSMLLHMVQCFKILIRNIEKNYKSGVSKSTFCIKNSFFLVLSGHGKHLDSCDYLRLLLPNTHWVLSHQIGEQFYTSCQHRFAHCKLGHGTVLQFCWGGVDHTLGSCGSRRCVLCQSFNPWGPLVGRSEHPIRLTARRSGPEAHTRQQPCSWSLQAR